MPIRQRGILRSCASYLATRPLLTQLDRTARIEADGVERVLADIDADHGDRGIGCLRHGVLLAVGAPRQLRLLAGQEHGRTIPLTDIGIVWQVLLKTSPPCPPGPLAHVTVPPGRGHEAARVHGLGGQNGYFHCAETTRLAGPVREVLVNLDEILMVQSRGRVPALVIPFGREHSVPSKIDFATVISVEFRPVPIYSTRRLAPTPPK